jgi:hypothetical protein
MRRNGIQVRDCRRGLRSGNTRERDNQVVLIEIKAAAPNDR